MTWEISGRYMETCNCDFVCPCILTGLAETTHGDCRFAMAYSVERGNFDGVDLAGTKFLIVGYTPGAMSEGNWKVGLIADDAASKEQTEALTAIVSGQSGGPIANVAPLIGEFAGVESRPVLIQVALQQRLGLAERRDLKELLAKVLARGEPLGVPSQVLAEVDDGPL